MKIILAVSGSIAAYKAAFLTRLWVKKGYEVQILMTDSARQFITPLTLTTLSKRPVISEIISESAWNNHVELGLWAYAFVVAPATAIALLYDRFTTTKLFSPPFESPWLIGVKNPA